VASRKRPVSPRRVSELRCPRNCPVNPNAPARPTCEIGMLFGATLETCMRRCELRSNSSRVAVEDPAERDKSQSLAQLLPVGSPAGSALLPILSFDRGLW